MMLRRFHTNASTHTAVSRLLMPFITLSSSFFHAGKTHIIQCRHIVACRYYVATTHTDTFIRYCQTRLSSSFAVTEQPTTTRYYDCPYLHHMSPRSHSADERPHCPPPSRRLVLHAAMMLLRQAMSADASATPHADGYAAEASARAFCATRDIKDAPYGADA